MLGKFFPFWMFLTLFKFAGGLHFSMEAPLGEHFFPVWLVGILVGATGLLQLLMDVPAGYVLDRFGYRKMLFLTTVFFAISTAALMFGLTVFTYLFTLFVSTFGWLFYSPGSNAYIINQAGPGSIGRFESAKDVFSALGIVLSSAVIVFAVNATPFVLGLFLTALFLFALIAIAYAPREAYVPLAERKAGGKYRHLHPSVLRESYRTIMRLRPASLLLISSTFTSAIFYAIVWFVVPLLIAHETRGTSFGIGPGIFDFSVVVFGFALGRIVDAFDKRKLMVAGLLIFCIAGTLLGSNSGPLFLLLGFVAAAGDELSGLSLWAWLYSIDREHESYGLISGIIGLFDDVGWTVGPVLAGFLYSFAGPHWAMAFGGLLVSVNLVIYFFFIREPLPEGAHALPRRPGRRRHKR